ncbi:MAG: FMN-binding protein [Breznakibacter sp.]
MLKKYSMLLFIGWLFFGVVLAGEGVDYSSKSLYKSLQKLGVSNVSALEEIAFSVSQKLSSPVNGKFFLIKENNAQNHRYLYVGRVNSCRAGGCSNPSQQPTHGECEYFDYYILFDGQKRVQTVSIFNYQASHGHDITAKGWLKQFVGYDGSVPLQVDKNIDAISGATISVEAITADVGLKTALLHKLRP